MSFSHYDVIMGFKVMNKEEIKLETELLRSMDPLITSKHHNRIYQEISITFLLISLVSDQVEVQGTLRMSDAHGHGDDKLCSISWLSPSRLWGHMMSPVPISSGELLSRMQIRCYSSSEAYSSGVPLASVRMLLRTGIRAPLVPLGNVFRWPSSESFSSEVFSSIGAQGEMLRSIAGYYSRTGPEDPSVWEEIDGRHLIVPVVDCMELLMDSFPALKGAAQCTPYWWFNHVCQDSAEIFKVEGASRIRESFSKKVKWDECNVMELYKDLYERFPKEVHYGHILDKGVSTSLPLVRACSEMRDCWKCKSSDERGESETYEALRELVQARRQSPLRLGHLMRGISVIMANNNVLPGWIKNIFQAAHFLSHGN